MSRLKIWPILMVVALVGVFLFIQDASFTSSNFKRVATTKSSSHKQKTTFFAAKTAEDSTDDENNAKDGNSNEEIGNSSDDEDEETKNVATKDNNSADEKNVASNDDDATNSNENAKAQGDDNNEANDNTKVEVNDDEDDNNTDDITSAETDSEEDSKKVSTESSTENSKITSTENSKESSSEDDQESEESENVNDQTYVKTNDNEDNTDTSEETATTKSNDSGESSKATDDNSENSNVENDNAKSSNESDNVNSGNNETTNVEDGDTLNAGNSTSTDNSTTNSSNSSNGSISFTSSTTNGTTWLSQVDFPSGFYACGAQVQIATYSTFEYMTGLAFIICNGTEWTSQFLSVVVEAVNANGSAGPWENMKFCPSGSFVSGESVLIEKLGTALVYIGLRLECDDENRTWIDVYAQKNESDVTEGRWEKDAWNAMAIEAVQLGYYDVDGHVAINRIKNILRKKNITNAYLNYSSDEQVWDRREFVIQKNEITNNGQGVMEFSETYEPYQRAEEIFRMDNGGNFTLSFLKNFKFAVPELTSNGSEIVIVETKTMEFGVKQEKVESGRSYEISYELPNCTSGELIEYGSITDLRIPFELDIYYNYGDAQKFTGTYEKTLFMKGSLNFTQVSNDTCTKVEEEEEKSNKGRK